MGKVRSTSWMGCSGPNTDLFCFVLFLQRIFKGELFEGRAFDEESFCFFELDPPYPLLSYLPCPCHQTNTPNQSDHDHDPLSLYFFLPGVRFLLPMADSFDLVLPSFTSVWSVDLCAATAAYLRYQYALCASCIEVDGQFYVFDKRSFVSCS
jgi:hypothetical protein